MPETNEVTRDKTEQERARDTLLRDYVEREHAKSEALKKKENPNPKQQFMKELRGIVESF